jgi:hypothetical protein
MKNRRGGLGILSRDAVEDRVFSVDDGTETFSSSPRCAAVLLLALSGATLKIRSVTAGIEWAVGRVPMRRRQAEHSTAADRRDACPAA